MQEYEDNNTYTKIQKVLRWFNQHAYHEPLGSFHYIIENTIEDKKHDISIEFWNIPYYSTPCIYTMNHESSLHQVSPIFPHISIFHL